MKREGVSILTTKRALISVSNKTGIVIFAQELVRLGWEIISTGGTAAALRDAGISARDVSDLTGFPEILDGRLKTLHPKVHGAILGRRDLTLHVEQMEKHGIQEIGLVAVNLYPFPEVIAKEETTLEEAIENIDIGGPAMIRAAAKNYRDVIIVVDPASYSTIVEELRQENSLSLATRYKLALEAFSHTAYYDSIISNYLRNRLEEEGGRLFPATITLPYVKAQELRYGENPQQKAALYNEPIPPVVSIASGRQIHGKELSFNNINDLQTAWGLVREFFDPAVVVVKHTNLCAAVTAPSLTEAYQKAYQADSASFNGGIIVLNREIDEETAKLASRANLEILATPFFSDVAKRALSFNKNISLMEIPLGDPLGISLETPLETILEASAEAPAEAPTEALPETPQMIRRRMEFCYDFKKVSGGLLLQEDLLDFFGPENWRIVTARKPTKQELRDLIFALMVVKHAKTNATVIAKRLQTIGIGAGQTSRAASIWNAVQQAGEDVRGSVMASDAILTFEKGVETVAEAGVTAIIQPGGSANDDEVIETCKKYGIAMVFTGQRYFKH